MTGTQSGSGDEPDGSVPKAKVDNIQSNLEVVLYALAKLGGARRKIATEEIAVEASRLAPDRFSWVLQKYRQFPDKLVTKTTLEDAKKTKYGELVLGQYTRDPASDGWTLTAEGARWLGSNETRIAAALERGITQTPKLRPIEVRRFRLRITRDPAYQLFAKTGSVQEVSWYVFADMLQVSPDAPVDIVRRKFDQLLTTAVLASDNEVIGFLQACEAHFARHLRSSKEERP